MDKLGIQWTAIAFQLVNFVVLVFLLKKFLFRPILKVLDERKRKIAASLALEESLKTKAEELEKTRQKILKEAKAQAEIYLQEARAEAVAEKVKLTKTYKAEQAALLAKLQAQQEARLHALEQQLTKKTVDLAAQMTRTLLSKTLGEAEQKALLKTAITELRSQKYES